MPTFPNAGQNIQTYSSETLIPIYRFGYVSGTLYHNPDGTPVAVGSGDSVAWGDIVGSLGDQTDLAAALASAGAETPTYSNDFTADNTGISAVSVGTITPDFANSQIVVGNGVGGAQRGVFFGSTQTAGETYCAIIAVRAVSGRWVVNSKSVGARLLGEISTVGWHAVQWTAVAGETTQPMLMNSDLKPNQTITIGFISMYTAPSSMLNAIAQQNGDSSVVRTRSATAVIGQNVRPNAVAGAQVPNVGTVAIAPGGLCGGTSYGVALGYRANCATGAGNSLIGTLSPAAGGEAVAVGDYATAMSWRDTAVGFRALAIPVSTAAYGFYAYAGMPHSVAMGRMGSLAHNVQSDWAPSNGNVFSAEPVDVYFGGGSCHRMAHPVDADSYTLVMDDRGASTPIRRVQIHGCDAFDSRVGGTSAASTAYADTAARNAIATTSRHHGMIVYVTGEKKSYLLNADFDTTSIKRVKSVSRTGTTMTLVYHEPHGLSVGETVTVWAADTTAYNGTYVVTTIPDSVNGTFALQLTFEHATSGTVAETNQSAMLSIKDVRADNTKWEDMSRTGTGGSLTSCGRTTTQRSRSGNVAKLKLESAHHYSVGNTITVSGLSDATFNATEVVVTFVTPLGGETFMVSYANSGDDVGVTADTDGTVTPHDLRSFNQPGRDITIAGGRPTGTGAHGRAVLAACSALDANPSDNVKGTLREFVIVDGAEDATDASAVKLRWNGTEYRVKVGASGTGPGGVGRALYLL